MILKKEALRHKYAIVEEFPYSNIYSLPFKKHRMYKCL